MAAGTCAAGGPGGFVPPWPAEPFPSIASSLRLEPAVCLGRSRGGQHVRHAQRQHALGRKLGQPGQLVALVQVLEDQHQEHGNPALGLARERPHRDDLPAVPHGGKHWRTHHRRVQQGVDAVREHLPHPPRHAQATRHHHVRAELADQGLVRRAGVGDHPQPLGPPQLDRVPADRARRPGHPERLAGLQGQLVEGGPDGQRVHRQGSRRLQADPLGHSGERVRGHHDELRLRATAGVPGRDRGHHPVAGGPKRRRVRVRDVDHPGQVHPGYVGWLDAGRHGPVPAGPEGQVGRIHRRRGDPHPHLARPRRRNRPRGEAQHLRPAELREPHGPHHCLSPCSVRIASSSSTPRTRRCGRRETGSPS